MRYSLIYICISLLLVACGSTSDEQMRKVDAINEQAYHYRYLDIDSSAYYSDVALSLSEDYPSGRAEALNNRAFVAYQQMYYDSAQTIINEVFETSRNQIELLCADVMLMKIAQRVGRGKEFFDSRQNALRRIKRINAEQSTLTPHMQRRYQYALSELHIVSSTYYYYLGQDSMAIAEIAQSEQIVSNMADTAQWLYYHYMVGSGGMIVGNHEDVCLQEFDHLLRTYTVGSKFGYKYFYANALQSLSTMIADSVQNRILEQNKPSELAYILSLSHSTDSTSTPAIALANTAFEIFRSYNDIFQMACVKRTLGELYFHEQEYEKALSEFLEALHYVERQSFRSTHQLPQWMLGFREQLSLTYSALNDSAYAMANREVYLNLLASTSQNDELQSRKEQLTKELTYARFWLYALLIMIVLSFVLALLLLRRMKRRAAGRESQIMHIHETEQYRTYLSSYDSAVQQLEDEIDETNDNLQMSLLNCARYRSDNVERRAKVSVVYSIIPYLDRIIAAVSRMKRDASANEEVLTYVHLLTDEIMRINNVLTSWIQISQGQVKLHVTSFSVQDVFKIVEGGRATFAKKNVNLRIDETAAKVKADKALTLFMVNTLADNARKFTPEGGEVHIYAQETDEYIEVSVADTGVGLSSDDVNTINDSKIYDPQQLGSANTEKGFGFGIMNCKGIIGKYRKTSNLFHVCDFGLESEQGRGSRFWFRLPRVLTLLIVMLLSGMNLQAKPNSEPIDTLALLREYNDSAIAAQMRHDWPSYRKFNAAYVRLHQDYTADASLPAYCARMQELHNSNTVTYALVVLFALIVLALFYVVLIRPRLSAKRLHMQLLQLLSERIESALLNLLNAETLPDATIDEALRHRLSHYSEWNKSTDELFGELSQHKETILALQDKRMRLADLLQKARFEEERIYVMNQILDNCLSTIKHETMYYPARTAQMVDIMLRGDCSMQNLDELNDLVLYYKRVYMLLYEQASRQLEQNGFHRERITLSDIATMTKTTCALSIIKPQSSEGNISDLSMNDSVIGDRDLLKTLLQTLIKERTPREASVQFSAYGLDGQVCFVLHITGGTLPDYDVFSTSNGEFPYLIAKQIIREHDAYSGMAGLRLIAHPCADGYEIEFTLKKSN